jgi:endonuclease/exonuclease/phosphatase (EEP) superfamily protein YafD
MQRIDYVWHTGALPATEARHGEAGGSDHLPMIATLRFLQ